jgi:hypothetical protein
MHPIFELIIKASINLSMTLETAATCKNRGYEPYTKMASAIRTIVAMFHMKQRLVFHT